MCCSVVIPTRAGRTSLFLAAVVILAFAPRYSARSNRHATTGDNFATFSHDAKGLEHQYQATIDAFGGKSGQFHQAFAIFSLPNPADWFAKYFEKAQAEELGWDYESELGTYERILIRGMDAVPPDTSFRVRCKPPHADPITRMQPRSVATLPGVSIPIEQFVTEFDPIKKLGHGRFSMLVNYVYVDGAFRYVGRGAFPFWSAPATPPKP
jgi:hypothetical protein